MGSFFFKAGHWEFDHALVSIWATLIGLDFFFFFFPFGGWWEATRVVGRPGRTGSECCQGS